MDIRQLELKDKQEKTLRSKTKEDNNMLGKLKNWINGEKKDETKGSKKLGKFPYQEGTIAAVVETPFATCGEIIESMSHYDERQQVRLYILDGEKRLAYQPDRYCFVHLEMRDHSIVPVIAISMDDSPEKKGSEIYNELVGYLNLADLQEQRNKKREEN